MIFKNITLTVLAFLINTAVGFILAPYVIEKLGLEAYGFVSLGSQFVNYIAVASIALNSMASRFISIEIHRGNWAIANKYFSSIWISNIIFISILIVPIFSLIFFLNRILNVSIGLLLDVQLLFSLLFINYFIGIAFSALSVSTFVTNKLYLKSWREIEGKLLYASVLLLLFNFFTPAVFFIGLATILTTIYTVVFNWYYLIKFLPQLKIRIEDFSISIITKVVSSGVWNTIVHLGQILTQGLDLLIVNVLLGVTQMGTLALSKTIPVMFITLVGMIASVFAPNFTLHYANGNREKLLASMQYSIKVLGVLVNVPIAIFAAFGEVFYHLWLPNQNATQLYQLSILALLTVVISGPINGIYSIFTATNKVKVNAMVVLLSGILNFIIVWILITKFQLGIFTVVAVSLGIGIARNILFTAPYGAKCFELPWYAFYPAMFKSVFVFLIIWALGKLLLIKVEIISWIDLIVYSLLFLILFLPINIFAVLERSEQRELLGKLKIKK